MKYTLHLFYSFLVIVLFSCNEATKKGDANKDTDSSGLRHPETYKPGLGEFMFNIQVHHAKLWFAGKNQNWALADFEIHEIMEAMEDIQKFNADRPEVKSIGMINPSLDSVNAAIQRKDTASFRSGFVLLTNTCNSCHKATQHGFNVIKIPDSPPLSNQEFKVQ